MITNIKPFVEDEINDFISNESVFNDDFFKQSGVKHIVFPSILKKNYLNIHKALPTENLDIYFAMKSTYSRSLISQAKNEGAGIEVSTLGELKLAKELQFTKIIAGGPKNTQYLEEALKTDCIISVDSLFELKYLATHNSTTNILLRISDPECQDRQISMKASRFGIPKKNLNEALEIIRSSKNISLKGFHFHADGYDGEIKRGFVKYFLDLILKLRKEGFDELQLINIGGGFRNSTLENQNDWLQFINAIEKNLLNKHDLKIWGNYAYGLSISEKNTILGRSFAESKGVKKTMSSDLDLILNSNIIDEQVSINDLLFENNIKLIIEPGFSLSTTAGITVMDVIGVKETSCGAKLVQVDGHMFSISSNMIEQLSDPLLISNTKSDQEFEGYIIGSLCREDDFIMKRKIKFSKEPVLGDKLVFFSTGSYAMSYEQCTPQRFEEAKYFCAKKSNNTWTLKNDN